MSLQCDNLSGELQDQWSSSYKTYTNPLLLDLEKANLGVFIGAIYVGCPTCADDLQLLSKYPWELQIMLVKCYRNSSRKKQMHVSSNKKLCCTAYNEFSSFEE